MHSPCVYTLKKSVYFIFPLRYHMTLRICLNIYFYVSQLKCVPFWSLVEMHCPVFQKPAGVTIHPPKCGLEPAVSGTVCQLSCPRGFILSGAREELRCISSGRWSANIQDALCKGRDQHKVDSVYAHRTRGKYIGNR